MMHVLITNDDGYLSPGLIALAEAVNVLGWRGTIVAPFEEMSGSSRSRRSDSHVKWERSTDICSCEVFHLASTPATCVLFALTSGLVDPIDLCLSGVNAGGNLGAGLSISGTFGAALEANSFRVPSIALSRELEHPEIQPDRWDWSWVCDPIVSIIRDLVACKHLWDVANINIPTRVGDPSPVLTQRSAQSFFVDQFNPISGYIESRMGYDASRLRPNDDIFVFSELHRVSMTLWSAGRELSSCQPFQAIGEFSKEHKHGRSI